MEEQNGNISPHKMTENGIKEKPPYSVETPYGFRLDLDFLKYVDDIEKGNTIKRVPIQRRSKGLRASTLPRHLNPSGGGYRPSPWGSTGALGPRSRLSDTHHHGYTSWAYDHRSSLSPTGLKSLSEMEARIKEFDEQPLGEHIRPHLLRASSLPLTVLLRQGSESTDDPGSLRSSRDHLGGRITSCEDVFYSSDSPRPQDCSGLLRRLTEALERVGELEMEVRVIPELRAQICILQEERERLRLGLNPHVHSPAMNGTIDPHNMSQYGTVDIKRPRHESHIMFPKNHSVTDDNPTHEWRTSTDLDELLTVTSLQAKVAVLEQKLHETGLELKRAVGLLREQQEESRRKDEKMEHLIRNPGVWVRAERVVVDQDGDETVVRSIEPVFSSRGPDTFSSTRTVTMNGQRSRQQDSVVDSTSAERSPLVSAGPGEASAEDTAMVVHHIEKIKRLLDEQWECLCADRESGEEDKPLKHPEPKVNSLQQEMMGLVDILISYYTQHGHSDGERIPRTASKSIMKTDGCARMSKNQHSGGVNEGCKTIAGGNLLAQDAVNRSVHGDWEQKEGSVSPTGMAAAQVDADSEKRRMEGERKTSPDRQMISGGTGSGRTDGGIASVEAEAPEKMAKTKPKPPGEQMERYSGSEATTGGRETMSADFMAACQFLSDHMDNMGNPNDDMRKALVVLFQHWFTAAAEEASVASRVATYLKEVRKATPSLLAFLVNLADDNGNTVLHYSVSHCNYSIVSLLLDTGVSDVNLQNNAGFTAVMLASLTAPDGPGGMEVVRKIMELGNINIRSNQTGQTALHLAVRHGRVVMVRLLLSCGADTNIQDSQGTTALMFASERGHTHIARLLLERSQCDLTLTDKRGQTALSIAMQGSHTDTAALLQAHAKARAL
ncbi:KN motif and ankyrin repeat domain-containing protein 4 isoform X1 [Lates calcarifer]|uniref:KN motif and ankyrin repeat domain-containing protein 4 isoform X1 n=1 Tax=Lates calcarifer TaxID=8187 RepID=A0AAJ7LWZ5_LATCA|nr:KN motif and ankyrin repeat domain-containing protein 4 isoform X1 [Lates calcarifer]